MPGCRAANVYQAAQLRSNEPYAYGGWPLVSASCDRLRSMRQEHAGRPRTGDDGCRRYMAFAVSFDTRAHILTTTIEDDWEPNVQDQWRRNREGVRQGLIHEFGNDDHERKITDFGALGPAPWSVVALHNEFTMQVRKAFVAGAYYPALVASGAVGERLLNQLVVRLRAEYADHPATVEVAEARSISNWRTCISTLAAWQVLDLAAVSKFNELNRLRNRAVHYGEHLDNSDARQDALAAVQVVQDIVQHLFAPMGGPPTFSAGTSGHTFIARASEELPLVRRFYLPACVLVSPKFEMRPTGQGWFDVFDDETYQQEFPTLSDDEFADHRNHPRR